MKKMLLIAAICAVATVAAQAAVFSDDFSSYGSATWTAGNLYGGDWYVYKGAVTIGAADGRPDVALVSGSDNHLNLLLSTLIGTGDFDLKFDFYTPANDGNHEIDLGCPLSPYGDSPWQLKRRGAGGNGDYVNGWNQCSCPVIGVNTWVTLDIAKVGTTLTVKNVTTGLSTVLANVTNPNGLFRLTWQPGMALDNVVLNVPEPATMSVLALGALALIRRRR